MADPAPSDIFRSSPADRQREQFVLQHGTEPQPETLDRSQEIREAEVSLDALIADVASGRLDIREPSMRAAVESRIRELRNLLDAVPVRKPSAPAQQVPVESVPQQENPLEHLVEDDNHEALTLMHDYERLLPPLARRLEDIGGQMERMRAEGIPDVKAYEQLRKQLTVSKEKMSNLRMHIVEISDGVFGASEEIVAKCQELKDRMLPVFERVEDIYQKTLGAHDAWLKQHAGEIPYGRRKADYGPYQERPMTAEFYDKRVTTLMHEDVAMLESLADSLIRTGKMTRQKATELLAQTDAVQEELQKLDAKTPAPQESRERRSLIDMLNKLRERLSEHTLEELQLDDDDPFAFTYTETPPPPPPPMRVVETGPDTFESEEEKGLAVLSAARAVHRDVVARYASVQHALTVDQRRALRSRIALLSSTVRHAERAAYRERFSHPVRTPAWLRSQGAPQVAARLAMERAANGSTALAQRVPLRFEVRQFPADDAPEATLASAPVVPARRGGLLSALGNVFKLK